MPKSQQLPKTIDQPVAPPRARLERVTRIEPPDRPPDKKIQVVHVYQWHLIIKALWPYAVLLAVIVGAVNIPFVEIVRVILVAQNGPSSLSGSG